MVDLFPEDMMRDERVPQRIARVRTPLGPPDEFRTEGHAEDVRVLDNGTLIVSDSNGGVTVYAAGSWTEVTEVRIRAAEVSDDAR